MSPVANAVVVALLWVAFMIGRWTQRQDHQRQDQPPPHMCPVSIGFLNIVPEGLSREQHEAIIKASRMRDEGRDADAAAILGEWNMSADWVPRSAPVPAGQGEE